MMYRNPYSQAEYHFVRPLHPPVVVDGPKGERMQLFSYGCPACAQTFAKFKFARQHWQVRF